MSRAVAAPGLAARVSWLGDSARAHVGGRHWGDGMEWHIQDNYVLVPNLLDSISIVLIGNSASGTLIVTRTRWFALCERNCAVPSISRKTAPFVALCAKQCLENSCARGDARNRAGEGHAARSRRRGGGGDRDRVSGELGFGVVRARA